MLPENVAKCCLGSGLRQDSKVWCPNRRLMAVKEAGFKRYVGASYPKSLLVFSQKQKV